MLRKIEFENMFIATKQNKGGRLVLFWRDSMNVTMEGLGRNYIDAIINKNKEDEWQFTFYGELETQRKIESWNLLRSLEKKFQIPQLCVGDFNELTRSDEKVGGNKRSHNQMQLFRDAIDECGFIDLGFTGSKFTWRKHYANGQSIWERLDRALCINEWLQQFGSTRVFHLNCCSSDHNLPWIVPNGMDPPPLSRPFRLEEMWLSDEDALLWPYVQSDQYSAKSGYFFLKSESRSKPTIDNIQPIQPKPPWKQIWSLSLPSKIKNFLWRACRNALPTKENLVRRYVITDTTCTFCTSQAEDVLHVICCCSNVSQVWDGDP